jgi:hypothetical protein
MFLCFPVKVGKERDSPKHQMIWGDLRAEITCVLPHRVPKKSASLEERQFPVRPRVLELAMAEGGIFGG